MTSSAVSSPAIPGDSTPAIVSPSISTSAGWGPVGLTTAPPRISVRMTAPLRDGNGASRSRASKIGVRVRPAIAVERPLVAHGVDEVQVQVPDDELAGVSGARLADQPALGADEVRGAVEVVVAVLFDPDPVDRADVVLVGDRRGRLLQLPQVIGKARARRARVEDNLRAVKAERPPPLGEVPVVADVDADPAHGSLEHRVAAVARPEVELLPEAGKVRKVVLAVLAEVRPVGVDHRGRVVEEARLLDLVHRQHHDQAELGGELREALGDRAGDRLGVLVELRLLHLAEVRSVEELLEADHPGAIGGGQPGLLLVVSDHAFLVARPDG